MATESRSDLARADDAAPRRGRRLAPVKTSALVIDHILDELYSGRLRSGDRIDLEQISDELGISRLPVREAILMLERDGILSTRYHRGVFVEPFDAESIMDDFEVIGLLSGIAVRRLAEKRDPQAIAELQDLLRALRAADPHDDEQTSQV